MNDLKDFYMKDFKKLADDAMSEIFVTEEMKDRVIDAGRRKSRSPAGRLVALAACAAVIFGVLNLTGVLNFQSGMQGQPDQQMNIFSATNTASPGIASLPGPFDTGAANSPKSAAEWNPATLEEAGASFGPAFLIPSYIPDSFELGQILASGRDAENAANISIIYSSGGRSFTITEQKENGGINTDIFKGYRKVKIGGSDGYIETAGADGNSSSGTGTTEVHWFSNNVHYSVTGHLTQEDALMTAELMLPLAQR